MSACFACMYARFAARRLAGLLSGVTWAQAAPRERSGRGMLGWRRGRRTSAHPLPHNTTHACSHHGFLPLERLQRVFLLGLLHGPQLLPLPRAQPARRPRPAGACVCVCGGGGWRWPEQRAAAAPTGLRRRLPALPRTHRVPSRLPPQHTPAAATASPLLSQLIMDIAPRQKLASHWPLLLIGAVFEGLIIADVAIKASGIL